MDADGLVGLPHNRLINTGRSIQTKRTKLFAAGPMFQN